MKRRPDENGKPQGTADQHFAHIIKRLTDPEERAKAKRKVEREARAKEKIADTGL